MINLTDKVIGSAINSTISIWKQLEKIRGKQDNKSQEQSAELSIKP